MNRSINLISRWLAFLRPSFSRDTFNYVLFGDGYGPLVTPQPDAHPAIIPNARDLALDFDDVALGNLFSHSEYLEFRGVSAR